MGRQYRDRRDTAKNSVAEWCGKHVVREEPVRSFRFHDVKVKASYDKGRSDLRPGFIVYSPKEGAGFSYTSFYAFTLTWTPGHMTIVGDLGELTIVHYHAMPTFEEACNWLQTSDYDYLLGKANVQREFVRDDTIEDIWRVISEEALQAIEEINKEVAGWEKDKPKWNKRAGMTKAEFDDEMGYWERSSPRNDYRFESVDAPRDLNRNLWRQHEVDGWRVPDGFYWAFRAWKDLRHSFHFNGTDDPGVLMTADGMARLRRALDERLDDQLEDEIVGWVYRDLGYDDYSPCREYPQQAFFQIAAMQHGINMLLAQQPQKKEKSAA
jgi:hypothetical protein